MWLRKQWQGSRIVNSLIQMIKKINVLIFVFKISKDHFIESNTTNVRLGHIIGCTCRSSQTM